MISFRSRFLVVCCIVINTLQHTATHCNTLQHTATHCNTLQCDKRCKERDNRYVKREYRERDIHVDFLWCVVLSSDMCVVLSSDNTPQHDDTTHEKTSTTIQHTHAVCCSVLYCPQHTATHCSVLYCHLHIYV